MKGSLVVRRGMGLLDEQSVAQSPGAGPAFQPPAAVEGAARRSWSPSRGGGVRFPRMREGNG
jgi:hypothetical protein